MFNKKGITDSKQKTLSCFLSKAGSSKAKDENSEKENLRKANQSTRTIRRPGLVYLESSSSEEDNHQEVSQEFKQPSSSQSFIPSPRKYRFSSIQDIIKEDKNYQNALDKIQKNLIEKTSTTFLDDSISPIKSQQAESTLRAKYLGVSKLGRSVNGKYQILIYSNQDWSGCSIT